jgi:molecular chaperone GrpE
MMDERKPMPADEGAPHAQPAKNPDEVIAELRAAVARHKDEAERNWQQFLHAAADLENYKKQAARQRDDAVLHARRALLAVVLVVVDNLERALEHGAGDDGAKIIEGIRNTHRQVLDLLAGLGVTPMTAKGQTFDPRYHEAVDVVAGERHDVAPGTVVEELQRGYLLNGEVLRHAKVRVAK